MPEQLFETETLLAAPREELFRFFGDAENLGRITPPTLDFRILTPLPLVMKEGALIDYRIHLHGFPMKWRTRITLWRPPFEFVDEQIRGPYRSWVHHHSFEESPDGGTLMKDRVRYSLPFPPLGNLALFWVRREVEGIFAYRRREILRIFAGPSSSEEASGGWGTAGEKPGQTSH